MLTPRLKRFLDVLNAKGRFGICEGCCSYQNPQSGSSLGRKPFPCDRLTLSVPYAAEVIDWEVIFNHTQSDLPPDFIFDGNFEPDLEQLPRLVNWDPQDPNALSEVIGELYQGYGQYQLSELQKYPRLHSLYKDLTDSGVIRPEHIEVLVVPSDQKNLPPQILFVMKLDLPFDRLPSHLTKDIEGPDMLILRALYKSPDHHKPVPSVCLSPRLEQILGSDIKIPMMVSGGHLISYITELHDFFTEMIETLDHGLSKRKAYIDSLIHLFSGGVLEYDAVEYSTATFLINCQDFHFILTVTMPAVFPTEKPRLIFRSAYHTDESERPYSKVVKSYPWSPRWSSDEMASRLRTYLQEVAPTFQRTSLKQGIWLKPTQPEVDSADS